MAILDELVKRYKRYIGIAWPEGVAFEQRVTMLVYPPSEERRLRRRLEEFETATKAAKHGWALVDITRIFSEWMAGQEYREGYFEDPEALTPGLRLAFEEFTAARIRRSMAELGADASTVVALLGVGSLYGFMRVSDLIRRVGPDVDGRLLVFFPGEKDGPVYHLLGGQDGFNYHAVPITLTTGELE